MAIFVEEFRVFALAFLNDVFEFLYSKVSIVGISLSYDFIESERLDCENV